MSDALVGHTGFVGGNLQKQHAFDACYNSRDVAEIRGTSWDTLVFAGAQGKKWWANQNPEADRAGIHGAIEHLRYVRARRVVLISTIDVLPLRPLLDESFEAGAVPHQPYGDNRLHLERTLGSLFETVHVIRLPALFGPGLKKNVVYDLHNDNLLEKINPASAFQYYDLTRLWADIELIMKRGIPLIHLVTEPLATRRILDVFFPNKVVGTDPLPQWLYDFRTRHAPHFGRKDGYVMSLEEVLSGLERFFATEPRAS